MRTYLTKTGWWGISNRHDRDANRWCKKAVYCKDTNITKVYEDSMSDEDIVADLDSQPFHVECKRGLYRIHVKGDIIVARYKGKKMVDCITAPAHTELIDFCNTINDTKRKTDLRIYIATPVTSRPEPSREAQFKAAKNRVKELKSRIDEDAKLCIYTKQVAGVDVCELKDSEPQALGKCVRAVLESDAIFIDNGYSRSKGCKLELKAAKLYGKQIFYAEEIWQDVDNWIEQA